jgi:hypothetical protein
MYGSFREERSHTVLTFNLEKKKKKKPQRKRKQTEAAYGSFRVGNEPYEPRGDGSIDWIADIRGCQGYGVWGNWYGVAGMGWRLWGSGYRLEAGFGGAACRIMGADHGGMAVARMGGSWNGMT